jgi:hypothetical protein
MKLLAARSGLRRHDRALAAVQLCYARAGVTTVRCCVSARTGRSGPCRIRRSHSDRRRRVGRSSRAVGRRSWWSWGQRAGRRSARHAGGRRREGGHDERRAEHVWVDRSEAGACGDRRDPSVGGAPFESLSIGTAQDRSVAAFSDREIDRRRIRRSAGSVVACLLHRAERGLQRRVGIRVGCR